MPEASLWAVMASSAAETRRASTAGASCGGFGAGGREQAARAAVAASPDPATTFTQPRNAAPVPKRVVCSGSI